ncbi:OTU domain-containing protein 4 [Larimichthys crocea]|uniref:OTU domain-containing protein 4 n=1 Tax=Larimichthys crocea TaxID=215358 RepID=UPI000F5DC6E4|nr:OTU domain-containing protein 4 [Larimichthys crocea]
MEGAGSPDEKAAERLMDEHLKSLGLHRKKVAKDGSCLFRAVAEQVLHCQSLHTRVRAQCVDFLQQNRDSYEAFIEGDFVDYLDKLQDPQQWVGEVEINALAVMYKRDFLIFQEPGKPAVNITDNNFKDKVRLCFLNGNHYDSVYPISRVKNAALCQSILYELLYDDIFKVDRSLLGACQRISRPSDFLSDDNMATCVSSDESDLDAGDALWVENGTNVTTTTRHSRGRGRGRHLLPERVRRSLNPTLFRNIEYDVWHKTKRAQQKMDYYIAAGMQFTVGDRCQVRLEGSGRTYNATIKEVLPNNGPVTVYIEELGKKQVPLWSLRPPSEEGSWSTVVNRDKRLSNGHGDWEDRGRGRGRGKHVPASSSVSQATVPGSGGRVLKQHSWPPQATVDEQTGAKANRSLKSVSSVETSFGLTEQERLAKEEEERNVALVEIQLRDEHSFPALGTQPGTQSDGGKKKGGDKKRSQRNKTKSPVEDVRASSPSAGERPKSSTPPLTSTAAVNTAPPADSSPPAAKPPANSDSLKAASSASATPAPKTSAPSCALATGTTLCSLPAAPSTKPAVTGGAVPSSVPSSASLFSFLTPVLPAASSPPTSHALSSSSPPPFSSSKLSSLPPQLSASPPPSSSLPPPTFIAPIAPSPTATHGFLPRSSPPVSSLTHSPSPPPSSAHHAAKVYEAPPVSGQTPNSLPNIGATVTASQSFQSQASLSQLLPQVSQVNQSHVSVTQTSSIQVENQTKLSPPVNQILMPQTQTESCLPALHQHQPQSNTDVVSLPQNQSQVSLTQVENRTQSFLPANQTLVPQMQSEAPSSLQHQSQVQYPSPTVAEVQSSHPAPGASYPLTSQASVPVSASMQPHPHLHVHPAQPPHPSQVPHPSLSLSSSPTHPSNTQNQTEAPLPPTQQAQRQADSPAHPPSQQSHVPHPALHALLQSAHPPHPQSIPGAVPLQQLSQIYQDPLYPGFPQGEKGDIAPIPPMSSSKSGDDLPQDINILRFFFNLGIKAYSMPMFLPYFYLLPLQQAHTLHPKLPSRSPSPTPHYLSSNAPTRHQEAYPHSQYPPTSASASVPSQYDHQVPLTEPSHPSEPSFNQAAYPVTQPPPNRMPAPGQWQQPQVPPPRNTSFPVEYPTPSPPYPLPPPLSQGYPPGQVPGHPMYRPSMPPYPPPSLGYQPSSTPEELQVNQGLMEQRQPANGDTMPGQRPSRVTGPAAASLANANNNRTVVVPSVGLKKEPGDSLTKVVLLVDPPLNPNNPILVSNPAIKDVPVSMTTVKTSSTPASPSPYDIISKTTIPSDNNPSRGHRGHQKPHHHPTNTYVPLGASETSQVSYLTTFGMAEGLSVGCSTEDDWEEQAGFKPTTLTHRGTKRNYRGGGGGGGGGGRGSRGHDPGRGSHRRRYEGEPGAGFRYVQYSSSHRGRGRERGY